MSGFLSQVPALEDHRHVLADVVDREWASVEQEHDHRLPCRQHRFDQFFLAADQIKTRSVAHVGQRPGFAGSLFVAADGEHDHVGLFRNFDRFGNLLAIFFGIAGDYRVFSP